ncbi:unnamed protein product [Effrenium voratum]|nr:unnamed protein product [Effrenium voratum]
MPREAFTEWSWGGSPLHLACLGRNQTHETKEASIAFLLQSGHSAKKKDNKGFTPLHNLCYSARNTSEFSACTSQLLHARAEVNARDKYGRTPLMDLCANDRVLPEMISQLLKLRADVQMRSRRQISALHELCSNTGLPSARALLEASGSVNSLCSRGLTPLHVLCSTIGDLQCRDGVQNLQQLLDARADPTMVDTGGRRPSEVLCSHFFRREDLILHGFHGPLCPEPLDTVFLPLLSAEAKLTGGGFEKKVEWFRAALFALLMHAPIAEDFEALPLLQVDRRQVLQSMCQQLQRLTPHMEDLMFGMETGQGAGLVRDLFSVFSSELAKEDYNLFVVTRTDPPRLALSRRPCFNEGRGCYYELVGKMMGLALLKEQHLPIRFALPLLKELLGLELCCQDLASLDPELWQRLQQLRAEPDTLRQLDLDFTLDEVHFGKRRRVCLVWGGEKIPVTKDNLELYLSLYAAHHLKSNDDALARLKKGFYHFCPRALILAASSCLKVEEFDRLLSGNDEIDIEDWKKHTKYDGPGAPARTKVVKWFWAAVKSMTMQERKLLLRFATGQTSAPIGGFKSLKSEDMSMPFTLVLKSRPEPGKLRSFYPTAATCSNMLQLPRYDTESDLKKYLAHVIQEEMMTFAEIE